MRLYLPHMEDPGTAQFGNQMVHDGGVGTSASSARAGQDWIAKKNYLIANLKPAWCKTHALLSKLCTTSITVAVRSNLKQTLLGTPLYFKLPWYSLFSADILTFGGVRWASWSL